MGDMATTPSRRIYNRTASAHINVSSPTSPPPSSSPSTPRTTQKSASPPPPTVVAPAAPVGAKKKKKKRSKAKSGAGNVGPDTPLGDEDLDYSRRDGDEDRDLTDDDDNIPDLVDLDAPTITQRGPNLSIPMTATSSASSKTAAVTSKSKKKKKKGKAGNAISDSNGVTHHTSQSTEITNPSSTSTQKIWNTTTAEEKERIKEFWLGLSEQERRNLVRVEKEHVSKRVKEGSKILNCSCHVCGRKQIAIEEELDVLYDAYYDELENCSPNAIQFGPEAPPDMFGDVPDEDDDEEYDDEEDYDDSQEGDDFHHHHHHHHHHGLPEDYIESRREIFNFGANLMAKGGVLTIADDLLQNQGKAFIDMMEKIADMRFKKEEEAKREVAEAGGPYEDDFDDDGDDDYEEDYPEDSEEDEDPKVAEGRRMEEGRRMFHIFAARMFEQRVLAAYREKVARERQQKLLEEIEEEERKAEEKSSKKVKEKERKKEKARLLKQQKEEERLKKEAEKAAEEAARKEEEEKKAEEQRKKKEEARLKREAERKQQELERLRKEEERRKRQAEERERQQEAERKKREKEEAAKKRREENLRKEKEAKEAKERELREKKEREEREKKATAPTLTTSKGPQGQPNRQSTPASPLTLPPVPAIPKNPTPNRPAVPPMTTTPPHQLINGSASTTPLTHSPSPHPVTGTLPHLSGQPIQQSSHFLPQIPPPPGTGFPSPSLRQFGPMSDNLGPNVHVNPMPGRSPTGVAPPLGIYSPLPVGNPAQYGRFPPPAQQSGYSSANHQALPHSRGFQEGPLPAAPPYPSPIGTVPSHSSPILPPPPKVTESGMSSPSLSHSRKTSLDALSDLPGAHSLRNLTGIGNSPANPPGAPPGLSRTIQRPAPIQRPQSTTSSGRGGGLFQDEEMGVGSSALLDEGVAGLGEDDEIIEPFSGSAHGFPSQGRKTATPFSSLGDKLWSAPPSASDTLWGSSDKGPLWGNTAPSSATEEVPFANWDPRSPFTTPNIGVLQDRIRDIFFRTDPQSFQAADVITSHLQRQYPLDRVTLDDVLSATQALPNVFQVGFKGGKWMIRYTNQTDQRSVLLGRMAPKPTTPPNEIGRNMLGSLEEVVRGFD